MTAQYLTAGRSTLFPCQVLSTAPNSQRRYVRHSLRVWSPLASTSSMCSKTVSGLMANASDSRLGTSRVTANWLSTLSPTTREIVSACCYICARSGLTSRHGLARQLPSRATRHCRSREIATALPDASKLLTGDPAELARARDLRWWNVADGHAFLK